MLDGLTLDQFAVFVTVVEEGSFSAAARKLGRAQSAITYTVQALEAQTGTDLFDRSAYRPKLTPAGRALLPRLTVLAALSLIVHQVLAGLFHLSRGEVDVLPMNVVFIALAGFVLWGREKARPITPRT